MAGKKPMNFKNKAAYRAWNAYGHASGAFARSPGNTPVKINNKSHKVNHSKKSK